MITSEANTSCNQSEPCLLAYTSASSVISGIGAVGELFYTIGSVAGIPRPSVSRLLLAEICGGKMLVSETILQCEVFLHKSRLSEFRAARRWPGLAMLRSSTWISYGATNSCAPVRFGTGAGALSMMQPRRTSVTSLRLHRFLFRVRAHPVPDLFQLTLTFVSGDFNRCECFLPGCQCLHTHYVEVDNETGLEVC